jgi:hypothetical protein
MKLSTRMAIHGGSVFAVLLLAGLSGAQELAPPARIAEPVPGNPVEGLELRIHLERAASRSAAPIFMVELRNVGEKDLLLNLGTMASDGTSQCPSAISLLLANSGGKPYRLERRGCLGSLREGKRTLFIPLPTGATFSLPLSLDTYWALGSTDFSPKLKPGTYSIVAQFSNLEGAQNFPPFTQGAGRQVPITERPFDTVNSQRTRVPTSNVLQFEVGS